jgi:hypothetical protein
MKVSVPVGTANGIAVVFSLYHLLLATTSLTSVRHVGPVIACMLLYAAATAVALIARGQVLPIWAGCFALTCAIVIPIVNAQQIPASALGPGYATWYVAAIGTLMVILVVRRRIWFAWVGIAVLIAHTILWDGPGAIGTLGVTGSVSWVAIATAFTYATNRAIRVTRDFVRAEQETADWQAAQDAHVYERQFRLQQTTRMALPMLERIISACGDLSPAERDECLHLEQAIRDEIRGRSLLSDDVRHEVMELRRGGANVQLHDDGGLDDVDSADLERIHTRLARALRDAAGSDNVVVRTVAGGSDSAVTVVGLRLDGAASESAALGAAAMGDDEDDEAEDDSVVLWLEIPRHEPLPVE